MAARSIEKTYNRFNNVLSSLLVYVNLGYSPRQIFYGSFTPACWSFRLSRGYHHFSGHRTEEILCLLRGGVFVCSLGLRPAVLF